MKRIILVLLIATSLVAKAQDAKQEIEKRINAKDMPRGAKAFLDALDFDIDRPKYYFEQDGDSQSFEAKFKYDGKKFSVEFSQDGALEDIEVLQKKSDLPHRVLNQIETYLESSYPRFKIEKTQAQFAPTSSEKAFFKILEPTAYELIVATKNEENKLQKLEMTFDANGNFVKSRKIIRRSYDFLLF